jgi:hypothetical protein
LPVGGFERDLAQRLPYRLAGGGRVQAGLIEDAADHVGGTEQRRGPVRAVPLDQHGDGVDHARYRRPFHPAAGRPQRVLQQLPAPRVSSVRELDKGQPRHRLGQHPVPPVRFPVSQHGQHIAAQGPGRGQVTLTPAEVSLHHAQPHRRVGLHGPLLGTAADRSHQVGPGTGEVTRAHADQRQLAADLGDISPRPQPRRE